MISHHANAYAKLAFFPNTFGCKMSSRQKYDMFFGNLLRCSLKILVDLEHPDKGHFIEYPWCGSNAQPAD